MWAISVVFSNSWRSIAGQTGGGMKAIGILILIVGLILGWIRSNDGCGRSRSGT
jgi:hypothetical protein